MDTMDRRKYWIGAALVTSVGGLYFVWISLDYVWKYITDTEAMYRGEYIQGAVIALFLSLPFWLLTSGLLFPARDAFTKQLFVLLNVPTILVASVVVLLYVYTILLAVLS